MSIMYRLLYRRCRNIYGIELAFSVQLGRRVIIEHQGGIVIHGNTIIGDGCIIRQNCTLGVRRMDELDAAPILGNDVQLGAGAVVLGRVRLGDGASIGANSVVLTDVPAGALAIGIPASIRLRGNRDHD
jgi:serine O-acetyltransferase